MDGDRHQYQMVPPLHGCAGDVLLPPHVSGMPPAVTSSMFAGNGPPTLPPHHHRMQHQFYQHPGMLRHEDAAPPFPPDYAAEVTHRGMHFYEEHHVKHKANYEYAQVEIDNETFHLTKELSMKVIEDRMKAAAANGDRGIKHSSEDAEHNDAVPATGKKRKNERCKSSVSSDAPPKPKKPRAPKGTRKPTKAALAKAAKTAAAAAAQAATPNADSRQESVHTPASSHAPTPNSISQQHLPPAIASGGARVKEEARLDFGGPTPTASMLLSQPPRGVDQRYIMPPMHSAEHQQQQQQQQQPQQLPPLKLPPFHMQFQPSAGGNNVGGAMPPNFLNSCPGPCNSIASSVRQASDGNSIAPGSNNSSTSTNTQSEMLDDLLRSMSNTDFAAFDCQGLTCEDITRTLNPAAVDAGINTNQNKISMPSHRPSSNSGSLSANQSFSSRNNNNSYAAPASNRNNSEGPCRAASTSSVNSAVVNHPQQPQPVSLESAGTQMLTAQDLDDCLSKLDPRYVGENPTQQNQNLSTTQRPPNMYCGPPPNIDQQAAGRPGAAAAAAALVNSAQQQRLFEQQYQQQHSYPPFANHPAGRMPLSQEFSLPPQMSPGGLMHRPPIPPQYAARSSIAASNPHHQQQMMLNDSQYMQHLQHQSQASAAAAARAAMLPHQIQHTALGPAPPGQNAQQHNFHLQQQQRAAAAGAAQQQFYDRAMSQEIPSPSPFAVGTTPKFGPPPPMYSAEHALMMQQQQLGDYSAREYSVNSRQQQIHGAPPPHASNIPHHHGASIPNAMSMQPGAALITSNYLHQQQQQQQAAVGVPVGSHLPTHLPPSSSMHPSLVSRHQQQLLQQQSAAAAAARYGQSQLPPPPSGYAGSGQHQYLHQSSLAEQNLLAKQQQQQHNAAYRQSEHPSNLFPGGNNAAAMSRAQQQQHQQQMSQLQQMQHLQPNMVPKNPATQQQQSLPTQRPPLDVPPEVNPAYMQHLQQQQQQYGAMPSSRQLPAMYGGGGVLPPPPYAGAQHNAIPPNFQQQQPPPGNSMYYGNAGPPPAAAGGAAGAGQVPFHGNR